MFFIGFWRESGEEEDVLQAKSHYTQAMVDGVLYKLGDDAYVKVLFSISLFHGQ